MDSHGIHIVTIANSIIGVSIIAMPYCFKQCGIFLSIIMLIFSSIISRLSCHFLLKSAIRARLRTFEFLAYNAFGPLGKFVVEVGMIGFLLGTCIAFFVVMGDLGPEIVAHMIGVKNSTTLRSGILLILTVFCVLPLGLLRNVDSLSGVCVATIGFYACLVLKIMAESTPYIISGDWYENVLWWRTEGALQCIPIFSMALFCQTQLFEIYQAIPNASLEKMNALIRVAVNICTCVYIIVGIFGYIALSDKVFTGNVLLSLTPSFLTEIIKIGFVLSLAFSFPLIIFPCRASLFSLIYKPTYTTLHDGGTHFIPETKFRTLTIFIIAISLIIGILIPNIELVLGLVGSTIGVSICVLFPATCFICMVKKNTNERILAQMMLCVGIVVMVLGTYANLNAVENVALGATQESEQKSNMPGIPRNEDKLTGVSTTIKFEIPNDAGKDIKHEEEIKEIRHEPPHPIAPRDEQLKENEGKVEASIQDITSPKEPQLKEIRREPPQPVEPEHTINEIKKEEPQIIEKANDVASNKNIPKNTSLEKKYQDNALADQVDAEAIKKEEKEISQQAQEDLRDVVEKLDLIGEMQKQNQQQQQQILEQQKKILEEMKQKKEVYEEQKQIDKAKQETVQQIQDIAKKAIESLIDDTRKDLLEAKVVPNADKRSKPLNLDPKSNNQMENAKVNPPVLLGQLPVNISNIFINKSNLSSPMFIPIPIMKSNYLNKSNNDSNIAGAVKNNSINGNVQAAASKDNVITENKILKDVVIPEVKTKPEEVATNVTIDTNKEMKKSEKSDDTKNGDKLNKEKGGEDGLQEIKSMRRDILSEHKTNMRNKRGLSDSNGEANETIPEENQKASAILNGLQISNQPEGGAKNESCDKP